MHLHEFEKYLNTLLKPEQIKDFCPNGLQIQGREKITKVICLSLAVRYSSNAR
mgnify:CR=1 FL=1